MFALSVPLPVAQLTDRPCRPLPGIPPEEYQLWTIVGYKSGSTTISTARSPHTAHAARAEQASHAAEAAAAAGCSSEQKMFQAFVAPP